MFMLSTCISQFHYKHLLKYSWHCMVDIGRAEFHNCMQAFPHFFWKGLVSTVQYRNSLLEY